jgi:hypothetical protein
MLKMSIQDIDEAAQAGTKERPQGTNKAHPSWPTRSKCSHIAVPALDGLADRRCRNLIGDLDVPHFAFALRGEVGEQLWDYRHIAYLVAAQAEAASEPSR